MWTAEVSEEDIRCKVTSNTERARDEHVARGTGVSKRGARATGESKTINGKKFQICVRKHGRFLNCSRLRSGRPSRSGASS